MYHLIPDFIQQNFARGRMGGEFEAVGLFVDISGFSTMTETLMEHGPHGAEVLAGVMRTVFEPFMERVYGHRGIVTTIQGDSFTAVFPLKIEDQVTGIDDDIQIACLHVFSAAWQIKEYLEEHTQVRTTYGSFPIQVKIGLASGSVRWGIVTSRGGNRATYYFQGAAVDGCAEAGSLARAGEIVLDARVFEHISKQASWEQIPAELLPAGSDEIYYRLGQMTGEVLPALPFDLPKIDPQILRLFFPETLLSETSSGEFRQVVNVFINLPTIRNETQLSAFLDTLFSLTKRYGGLFKRVDFGDKGSNLLLFWGVPVTYENDVERALNFIVDLQSLTSIPINAGITYQISHAGFIRSPLFEEYTCYGWGLNLAARFMTSAKRGEIWVDEAIAVRARDRFEFEENGERLFKGFSRKQRVFILHERKEEPEPFFSGEMVGRKDEFLQLRDFIAPLLEGKFAGILTIWGEAGIGKSRLVHEFMGSDVFRERPVQWALCQCDEILRQPLNPFRYWLYRFFEQSDLQTESRNKRNFNRILDDLIEQTTELHQGLADELDRTRSFLGGVIDLTWTDSLYEQLDPEGRNENILIALISLFKAASLIRPVVIFLEDAHWLDDESRGLLPRLVRSILTDEQHRFPIALVATARADGVENVPGDGGAFGSAVTHREVFLTGIERPGLAELAASRLGKPVSVELVDLLVHHAEGNPFFAEQILVYLGEQGLLVENESQWQLSSIVDFTLLPVDVRALLVSRLDRLEADVKMIVQAASTIGREFEYPLLVQMLQNDQDLRQRVDTATQAAIWSLISDVRYLFKHSLLRDAAYSMMVLSQRKRYHTQIIAAMESLYAKDLGQYYGELAFHSERAEIPEKARHYLRLAGNTARDLYRNNLAVTYYTRALALTPTDDSLERFDLVLEREALYNLLGDHEAQLRDLELLEAIISSMGDESMDEPFLLKKKVNASVVYNRWSGFHTHNGDYQKAASYAQQAFSSAQEAGAFPELIDACLSWALSLYRQAQYEPALALMEESIELARQEGDTLRLGRLLNMYGLIAMDNREPASVSPVLEESRQIARETNNLTEEALVLNNLGNLAGAVGNISLAQKYYQQSLMIAQKIGHRRGEGLILGNLGWISGLLGDYTTSRAYCEQNLKINREVGSLEGEAYALINLGSACNYLGESSQALSHLTRALEIALQTEDHSADAWSLTYRGHAHLDSRELVAAEEDYRRALEIRRELNQLNLAAEPLAGLSRVALTRNEISRAVTFTEEILNYLDGGGTLDGCDEPLRVFLTCYQVLDRALDDRARRVLQTAYEILTSRAARIVDIDMRSSFLSNVPYHQSILDAWRKSEQEQDEDPDRVKPPD